METDNMTELNNNFKNNDRYLKLPISKICQLMFIRKNIMYVNKFDFYLQRRQKDVTH
jgi:hypothetical protein